MDTKPTSLLRRVRVNGRNYFVVPDLNSKHGECYGCANNLGDADPSCAQMVKPLADQDKCGLNPVIYIHATQDSLAAYTAERLE